MYVYNITSPRSGQPIRNQFSIENDGKKYFQSYDSLIAEWDGQILTLGIDWDYSVTTLKYLYQWIGKECYSVARKLNEFKGSSQAARIRKAIDAGIIKYNPNMR